MSKPHIDKKFYVSFQRYKPTYIQIVERIFIDYDTKWSESYGHTIAYNRYCNSGALNIHIDQGRLLIKFKSARMYTML